MVGFPELEPTNEFLDFINEHQIGSVILFAENYESPDQLKNLIQQLKEAGGENLLIAVDQEGGRVIRFNEPFSKFPSMRQIASTGSVDLAHTIGVALARELSAVGVDWDLAPVLDIDTNPNNPVIGDRAFGNNQELVSRFACSMFSGLHEGGVLSCGKHFPGHGDTNVDSHLALPIVNHTKERWGDVEFLPFMSAIKNGIPAIMTAHIIAKGIDNNYPASISKIIIDDVLRGYMKFDGIVITDDLVMKGISEQMSIPQAVVTAVNAGSDMVIIRGGIEEQKQSLNLLLREFENGNISERKFEASHRRHYLIREARESLRKSFDMSVIGCDEHKTLIDEINDYLKGEI